MSIIVSLFVALAICYLSAAVVSGGARHMIRSIAYHPQAGPSARVRPLVGEARSG
jgi:hypothetical protein